MASNIEINHMDSKYIRDIICLIYCIHTLYPHTFSNHISGFCSDSIYELCTDKKVYVT